MKRMQWIILKNFWRIPGLMIRLNRRIRSPENYTDEERLEPIQYFCRKVQENGNISVELSGQENIPKEGGFIFYPNHQGLFDAVAIGGKFIAPEAFFHLMLILL